MYRDLRFRVLGKNPVTWGPHKKKRKKKKTILNRPLLDCRLKELRV